MNAPPGASAIQPVLCPRQKRRSDQGSVRFAPVWDSKVSHYRLACFAQRRRALWACLGEMCRCCILPPWMAVYNCGVGAHDGVIWAFSGDGQFRWRCRYGS